MKKLIALTCAALLAAATIANANATTRNPQEAANFRATHACPATGNIQRWCKGYVVDHIIPLCAGGADDPSNMQWQDKQASYRKDILERAECAKLHPKPPHTHKAKTATSTNSK